MSARRPPTAPAAIDSNRSNSDSNAEARRVLRKSRYSRLRRHIVALAAPSAGVEGGWDSEGRDAVRFGLTKTVRHGRSPKKPIL